MGLQFRRGTAADVASESLIPQAGEPVYVTDQNALYIGDGSTAGGNLVGGASAIDQLNDVHLTSGDIATIQSFAVASNICTIFTSLGNNYKVGQQVTITNAGQSLLNGTHTILTTPGANQITFALTNADTTNTLTTGVITPIIAQGNILSWNATNLRFEDKPPSETIGALKNHADVNNYDTTTDGYLNTDVGKSIRYDYSKNWSVARAGALLRPSGLDHFFGIDWSAGSSVASIYTGNADLFTFEGAPTLGSSSSTFLFPPYGDAINDDASTRLVPTTALVQSSDFTLDFWFYRPTSQEVDEVAGLVDSSGNVLFGVKYSGTLLKLVNAVLSNGTVTSAFTSDVVQWSTSPVDPDNRWTHVAIVREGVIFRAWVNGTDLGAGTLQGSYTNGHDFRFDLGTKIRLAGFADDGVLLGPTFLDFKKAHHNPFGGDIRVPTSRQDFYTKESEVNVNELKDVESLAPVNGDTLTYNNGVWLAGKPLYAKVKYNLTQVPTSTVSNSDSFGEFTGIGTWDNLTFENTFSINNEGPLQPNHNPTLELSENSSFPGLAGMPAGLYKINLLVEIKLDNLSANSYIEHSVAIKAQIGNPFSLVEAVKHFVFTTHGTAPSAAITKTVEVESIIGFIDTDVSENGFECVLDQDQSPSFYVNNALLTVFKIG